MRTPFVVLMVAVGLFASCGASPTPKKPPTPQVTSVGKPSGAIVSTEIGPAGGTLSSADGKLSVRVPAGALSANATLTVQSISAEAPGAVRAWRLGPEGQTFLAPVELVVTYGNGEVAGSAAELLEVGFQNTDGVWSVLKQITLDSTAKTVTAKTTHFSDWSLLQGIQLLPQDPTVLVGETVSFVVNTCQLVDQGNDLVSLRALCVPDELVLRTAEWSVNGAAGGSQITGTVKGVETGTGEFLAPATKPNPSRVAVSTAFTAPSRKGLKGLLVSNVTIVEVKGWSGTVSYSVSGSKTVDESGTSGTNTTWTRKTVHTLSGDGTVLFEPGGFPDSLVATNGSGTWADSAVVTNNVVHTEAACPYTSKSTTDTRLAGPASNPASALALIQVTGSSYQLSISTLGGDITGTRHISSSGTVTPGAGATCSPITPVDMTDAATGSIPTAALTLEGTLDPAHLNEISSEKTFLVGTDPERSYVVRWQFKK